MDTDSTVTSLDENTENYCDNPTRDILAEGIISVFKPTVDRLDEKISSTISAQCDLTLILNQIQYKLKLIEDNQRRISDNSIKAKKILDIKAKITVIANVLQVSQERLQSLHKYIELTKSNSLQNLPSGLE